MIKIKKTLSRFKQNAENKIRTIKNKVQNSAQKFEENFSETKSKTRSKRKSLLLGFTAVLGIFEVTLLAPVLQAVAKDMPKKGAKPGKVSPAPTSIPALVTSEQIIGGLSGTAANICALAVGSGPFMIGVACDVIVVVGILKAQGK